MNTRNEPLRYLGWIGLGTIAVLALVAMARDANAEYGDVAPQLRAAIAIVSTVITAVAFALFGWAFWSLTTRPRGRVEVKTLVVLVGQLVIAIVIYSDLLVILAAQLPLALPRKAARTWLVIQLLACVVFCATLWGDAGFVVASGLERAAYPVAFALTVLLLLTWQGLAYAIGWLAMTEGVARRTAESVTRELLATRPMLASAARSAERLRIARELHDTVGHHLTGLTVQLEIATNGSGALVADSIQRAQQVSRLLLADVREVVHEMRSENSNDLLAALRDMTRMLTSPQVTARLPEALNLADPVRSHTLLRVAQEGVTNAIRHAAATRIELSLSEADGRLVLSVADDGRTPLKDQRGSGLRGVAERVEALNGTVTVGRSAWGGWELRAEIPIDQEVV